MTARSNRKTAGARKTAAPAPVVEGASTVIDDDAENARTLEAHARRILGAGADDYRDKLEAYQRAASLDVTGELDAATWAALTR
jgi:hypothetical protein